MCVCEIDTWILASRDVQRERVKYCNYSNTAAETCVKKPAHFGETLKSFLNGNLEWDICPMFETLKIRYVAVDNLIYIGLWIAQIVEDRKFT